jgi:hypothetical protein
MPRRPCKQATLHGCVGVVGPADGMCDGEGDCIGVDESGVVRNGKGSDTPAILVAAAFSDIDIFSFTTENELRKQI